MSENFLTRWSRLKREQAAARAGVDARLPDDPVAPSIDTLPVDALPLVDVPPPTVDLASLPPIDSMGAGSDVSAYLGVGVPLELTQAALRSAWRADPAVRDFVEIADNQWDFNTPGAIPGFGDLGAAEEATALVARAASGTAENTVATFVSSKPVGERPDSQDMTGRPLEDSRVVDPVWQAGAGAVPVGEVERTLVEAAGKQLEPEAPPASRRSHGSALPK